MDIKGFWQAVLSQRREEIRAYFHPDALINWHCSNECFTVDEFIEANCDYPNEWEGEIERIEKMKDLIITAVNVYTVDKSLSFHVVSFIKLKDDQIMGVDEYWGDDGMPPQWRLDKKIGRPIRP